MKKLILIFTLFNTFIFAQQIRKWQNYTNLREISDIATDGSDVWASTSGGVFRYSLADESYQILTKSEGLASHSVTSIEIDTYGKIWAGTSEGYINVYDPATNEMSTILQIFKTEKSNKRINDILISGDTAYISTEFGLSLVNTRDLSFFDSILKFGNFSTETPVFNVYLDDKIYVVTQSGIASNSRISSNLIAPDSWENISIEQIPGADRINRIVRFNGELYAATDNGLYSQLDEVWTLKLYDNFEVFNLSVNDNGLHSVLSSTIHVLKETSQLVFRLSNHRFSTLEFFEDNYLIGTDNGIKMWEEADTLTIVPNSPETNSIIDLTVDSDNNLWVATGKDGQGIGVLKFDGSFWETINMGKVDVFRTNDFHSVNSSGNALYLSSWGRGFVKVIDENYELFDAENSGIVGIPNANSFLVVNDIKEDSRGNAWILNYWAADRKPISVLTAEGLIRGYQFSGALAPGVVNVKNLVIDQFDTKWITGDLSGDVPTEGLYYFNENGTIENTSDDIWGRLTERNGLRNRDVKALAIDQFGELVIGTSVGVDVLSNTSDPSSIRGDQYFAVRLQTINDIVVDPINQKWFATEKGIFITNSDGSFLIENFTKSNSPLPSDNVKTLALDENKGIVYAGTDFGVTAIHTLFIKPNENFSDLSVYPNPIILDPSTDFTIFIEGLIEDSEIKILDISGNLISQFRSIGGKTTTWNCRNFDGKLISSGIYIAVAFDEEQNEVGHAKFAVLRK
jgi:ligand-binding sensor domain-containing protein